MDRIIIGRSIIIERIRLNWIHTRTLTCAHHRLYIDIIQNAQILAPTELSIPNFTNCNSTVTVQ